MFKELREGLLECTQKKKDVGERILKQENKNALQFLFVFFYFIFEDLKSSASGV